jgi:hypothetical protein
MTHWSLSNMLFSFQLFACFLLLSSSFNVSWSDRMHGIISIFLGLLSYGARSEICQPVSCCQHVMLVCCLFFNFAVLFDFGCCSLAQKMSFVDCYWPCFKQQLITRLLLVLLPFQSLFTVSSCRDQFLGPLSFFSALSATPPPLLCVPFQFFVYCSVFCFFVRWGSVCPGAYAGLSQGWLWEYHMTLGAHLLVCGMSPKQVWSQRLVNLELSYFLSVMWHGEALYRLGVRCVTVMILLAAFFLPSAVLSSQQDFWFMDLTLSASAL